MGDRKMSIKITCYGVRDLEVDYFNRLNKYNYELTLVNENMNDENVVKAAGSDAIIIRGNCKANRKNLEYLSKNGVKAILSRTVGYNHIDLDAAKEFGMKVATVPAYSPNAIAELAVTLSMMLLRNTAYAANRTKEKDFRVDEVMFSKEIRNCTVGVLGAGRIGVTSAKLFKGLGARVVAFDVFQSDAAKEVVEFMSMDEVLAVSDIITIHLPYIKDKNYHVINEEFISKMKDGAILINTARGELQDNKAIADALESGKLAGYGTDVFENESSFFFKDLKGKAIENAAVEKLVNMFPKVLVTPHIGSYTDEALKNMVIISYENMHDFITTGKCKNEIA